MLSKLIGLIALRRSSLVSSAWLTRLLTSFGTVLSLSLITAFLASVLLAGVICLAYNLMIVNGIGYSHAMTILAIACAVVFLLLVMTVLHFCRKIKILIAESLAIENPIAHRASALVYAFLNGLLR